ncbi:MAG: hypothetical protein LBI54_07300 [Lachnospiraceae bacterium]|nr:hypothetical protein [Lachnospiraceae bacterium]
MLGFVIPCIALTVIAVVLILMWNHFAWFKAGMLAALEWAFANTVGVAVLLLLAAGAIVALSYLLSCRAYEKREFCGKILRENFCGKFLKNRLTINSQ